MYCTAFFYLIFCGFTEQVQVMFALCRCGGGPKMRENISSGSVK